MTDRPGTIRTTRAERRPATVRVARWSAEHPWRAITLWIVLVAASLAAGQLAGMRSLADVDQGVGGSGHAAHALHDAGLEDASTEDVLVTAREGQRLDVTAARAAAKDVTERLAALSGITKIDRAVVAPDGSAVLVQATLAGDPATASDRVQPLLDATAATQRAFPQLRVEQVGGASLDDAINAQVGSDLSAAATISLPVTLAILLVAFGALLAAGVPVLLALSSVAAATGLSQLASHLIPDSGTTSSMILLIGMAVGVDYSLFYVRRAREERAAGRDTLSAVEIAAETSGHSVLVSGVAVIVSMLGLFVADQPVFSSLAAGAIFVVAVAVIGSLTVLPAFLVLLGPRIDRPRVPIVWRLSARADGRESRLWSAVLRGVLARPGRTLVVTVVALLALAAPALALKLQTGSAETLPRSIAEVRTLDRLAAAFPGEQTQHVVVVEAPASRASDVETSLAALERHVATDPLFAQGATGAAEVRASSDRTVHALALAAPFDPDSPSARQGLDELRDQLLPTYLDPVGGATWSVGGDTATNLDESRHLADHLPWVVAFVVLVTMVLMASIFRSVWLAVVTAVANLLSAGAAFGVLVLVFQHTWAEGLLDFRSTGAIISWIPLFTFAVLFGLSMDYHVFVVSRIREAAAAGLSTRDAVRAGVLRSAGTVTSAALIMVSVFAIFAALHMTEMKQLGVGLAAAVLVDALVVRTVLLPAAIALLGERVWWPGSLSRRAAPATDEVLELAGVRG
ncbi:MMPL family transporter [Cellulomonas alba]|uniref:MMPL family transporter n=1 Tax=Cellulomonas alba TaxID=3053467 RepID=A0ABT7SDX6_9CELL|nr:MMPL family transporter [Cellulomonas alba]MDM7853724.1 MMPL family transporter [Cellulomonas alba]